MAFNYFLAAAAVLFIAAWLDRSNAHLAMRAVPNHRAAKQFRGQQGLPNTLVLAMMGQRQRPDFDPLTQPRPWWNRIGLGTRPPRPPVVGKKAWVQWWERLRSLVLLAAVVATLGLLLALAIGVFVFLLGFLLEQAVS